MRLPGFTAESSVCSSSRRWLAASVGSGNTQRGLIMPQSEVPQIICSGACCVVYTWECNDDCLRSGGDLIHCCSNTKVELACGDRGPILV